MKKTPELIVMLTHNDFTVENAREIFEQCKDSKANFWGFKEHPLPLDMMKQLYSYMKECGKTTFLEVVAYTEEEGIAGAKMAAECGCDVLMGTMYSDAINGICKTNGMKYMPFVGQITGRPSVLEGTIEGMIEEAKECLKKGVYGFDLLGYRYTGDAVALNKAFVENIHAPVCLAGSIDSYQRLDEVKDASPWAFTIGSAFFENKFDGSFAEQINKVCDYMHKNEVVDYYDTIANDYDESRFNNSYGRFIDAEERKVLDKIIGEHDGTKRLEMACGTGRLTNYATHGLDASNEMMAFAKKRHEDVQFCQASACETGFADASFDLVYTFHLLMHLDEDTIQQIFDEAYRILKPGGRFIFDIPSKRRRTLLHHKQANWHGATDLTKDDVMRMAGNKYEMKSSHGIMMLPVHKLPVAIRKPLTSLDFTLANSSLKEYSSYIIFELVKK